MQAVFFDGLSLAETPVRVSLSEHALHLYDMRGLGLRTWTLAGLHVDAMQEGGTCYVTHASAPSESLVLYDAELAGRLLAGPVAAHRLPGGRHKLAYGIACLLALGALMAGLYALTPVLARVIARRIPIEHERALGAELEVLLELNTCKSPEAEALLRSVLSQLGGADALSYDVRILRLNAPNAFALPGGVLLVTEGFLREAESGEELVGVLAHELEHIAQRHVLAGFLRGALLTALWSITLGDYSGLLVVDPATAYRIANLEFSRADEQAADDGAVTRLHARGMSHKGLLTFFERIAALEGEGTPAWLSSHPSTAARIARLRAVPDLPNATVVLGDDDLAKLRVGCLPDP